jgi:hypothetical protein
VVGHSTLEATLRRRPKVADGLVWVGVWQSNPDVLSGVVIQILAAIELKGRIPEEGDSEVATRTPIGSSLWRAPLSDLR